MDIATATEDLYSKAKKLDSKQAYCEFYRYVINDENVKLRIQQIKESNPKAYDKLGKDIQTIQNGCEVTDFQRLSDTEKHIYRNAAKRVYTSLHLGTSSTTKKSSFQVLISTFKNRNVQYASLFLLGLGALVFAYLQWQESQAYAKLIISDVSGDFFFSCDKATTPPKITFRVISSGKREVQSKVGYGAYLINQTRNNCSKNITFFNNSLKWLCQINTQQPGYEAMCSPNVPPVKLSVGAVPYIAEFIDVDLEPFLNKTKKLDINSSCEMEELVSICPSYEGKLQTQDCSDAGHVRIFYEPCK